MRDEPEVCEGCAEMDGQIVGVEENYFDKGDSFVTSSGKEFDFGFDSVDNAELHPNCRCDIVPVFEGEKSTKETFRRRIAERVVKAHEEKIRLENLAKKEKELHRKEKKLEVDLKEVEEFKKELEI